MMVHTYNPSTRETEIGGSQVQLQPGLHSIFKATLDCVLRLSQKPEKPKGKKKVLAIPL
jgi:hypothetical protein